MAEVIDHDRTDAFVRSSALLGMRDILVNAARATDEDDWSDLDNSFRDIARSCALSDLPIGFVLSLLEDPAPALPAGRLSRPWSWLRGWRRRRRRAAGLREFAERLRRVTRR